MVVAGGGHEYQKDANDVAGSYAGHTTPGSDAYPIVTTGADGKPVLIVTTDTEFSYLGRLVVDFDSNGELILSTLDNAINGAYSSDEATLQAAYGTSSSANTIIAASTIGAQVKTITDALNGVITTKEGTIYGYTNVYLEGDRVFGRTQEVNLGNITADANIFKARSAFQTAGVSTGLGAIFSLKNGGGLRASVGAINASGAKVAPVAVPGIKPAGAVSLLDVENALRFDNKLMVFDTTPTGLLNILNYAAGLSSGPSQQSGGYPQVGNIRFSYDPARSAGQKVRNAALYDDNGNLVSVIVQDGAVVSGAPSTIRCVALNFTANGGDSYPIKYLNPPTNTTVNNETSNFRYVLANGNLSASVTRSLDFTASTTYTSLGLSASDILGEQKAFQDFVVARHGSTSTAYNQADTPASQDLRIQILSSSGRGSNDTVITPAYRFADTAFTATQNDTSVSISINRTYGANAGSVTIRTDNGTTSTVPPFTAAVAGTDYTDADGTVVNFAAGETTKTVSLTLSPKTGATVPNRRFSVVLTASADGVLGTPSTAEVQILAVDTVKPTLTITSPAANAAISDLSPYTIQGIAGDARGIDRVTVALNGAAAVEATLGSATVTTSVPWSIDVAPATDSNSIVVTAYDLSGNSTALTRSFTFTQRTLLTLARTAPSGIALDAAGTVALAASPASNASALTPATANADPRS
ncbi:MAG: 5'-nucleotidase, C-terminal domain, partial [Verrucomicrobia bacterium]